MNKYSSFILFAFFCIALLACNNVNKEYVLKIPEGWFTPSIPDDKKLTEERILLGRKLFYDPILSANGNMSCASCHKPQFAFADSVIFSGSHDAEFKRNTPTLFNVAWHPHFFAEGGVPTLELVAAVPIQSKSEMGFNLGDAVRRLAANDEYLKLFKQAYDTVPSTYTLVRALSAFQRTLISGNSPYDKFVRGNSSAISAQAKRGLELFSSDSLNCSSCHSGFLFTDVGFHNVGLSSTIDPGRYRLTSISSDLGAFKTPSLRNIAITGPFMHDGSLKDLSSVIDFYENGGGVDSNKSELLKPFRLSPNDKQALIVFLQSLTDSSALSNPDFLPLK